MTAALRSPTESLRHVMPGSAQRGASHAREIQREEFIVVGICFAAPLIISGSCLLAIVFFG